MWTAIISAVLLFLIVTVLYLVGRVSKFSVFTRHIKTKKALFALSFLIVAVVFASLYFAFNFMNAVICLIHLMLIWLICDFIAFIIKKLSKKACKIYISGIAAVVFTVIYLSFAYYGAMHVTRTEYNLTTEKPIPGETFKIVGFSDSHIGTTFNDVKFSEYIEKMSAENADIAVIAGDYVDDDTSFEDMQKCCAALSNLHTKYGVYFVFGNHDSGYFSSYRGFDRAVLIENLEANGVVVLEDDAVTLENTVRLIGRKDRQSRDRSDIAKLCEPFSDDDYLIVLNHQPNDYSAESEAKADLVISGHTHGGQFFPINDFGEWIGANDFTYGHTKLKSTDFIVSSGIADWALKFKTGCVSEYFVININK